MEYREFFLRVWHKMNDSIMKQLETRVEKKVPKKSSQARVILCARGAKQFDLERHSNSKSLEIRFRDQVDTVVPHKQLSRTHSKAH